MTITRTDLATRSRSRRARLTTPTAVAARALTLRQPCACCGQPCTPGQVVIGTPRGAMHRTCLLSTPLP